MIKRGLVLGLLAPTIMPLVVFAYANPGNPTGFVNDFAGLLDGIQRQQLEQKISEFEKATGNEIAVATINNLGGDTIENFAVKLFEDWKIGKDKKDNGILILIAKDEHQVRIEVGYGLEGSLTDLQSSWIIKNQMISAFQQNNFYQGINDGVDKVIAAIGGEVIPSDMAKSNNKEIDPIELVFAGFFGLMWLSSILARSKSWWAGGVVGVIAGVIIGLIKGFMFMGIISLGVLIPLGLLLDFVVSRSYAKSKALGIRPPWWIGGSGFGGKGGGGFGGFGGGHSGGGGASGRW